jgi:nitrate/TMAO reductase-like tetraheme cytochrome c subunit
MASVLGDFWNVVKKHRKTLTWTAVAAVLFIIASAAVFVRVSESPRFCLSCHIMEPYYKSWEGSSHNDVNCLECHYPPTLAGHAESKFRAISQVVQYFTGSYGTRLWAEIDDEACLREGCHEKRLLERRAEYKEGIAFDHAAHLGEMRRGKRLRCTSCHSQIVIGNHIAVTESVCFACHFKGAVLGKGTADCLICHGPPGKSVTYKGVTFDHAAYVERGVPCTKCHMHVVEGDGAVPDTACYRCHADRSGRMPDPTSLHRVHVTDHKVECFECHLEIKHGTLELSPLLAPDCASCHGYLHSAQENIYLGIGGVDTPSVPSAKFEARISCAGCHGAAPAGGAFPRATGESCGSCHGAGYERVLARWQRDTGEAYRKGTAVVAAAKAAVYAGGGRDPARAHARTLIAQAEKNLELVAEDGSWGAHNVIYANALIETAVIKAAGAAKAAGRKIPYAPAAFRVPAEEDTCAWRCHFGVERRPMTVRGKTFDHGRHLSREGIECASCHDLERHGLTLSTAYNCSGCHHARGDVDCSSCHGDVSLLTVIYRDREFDHGAHVARSGLGCNGCHPADSPSVIRADCSSCHHKDEAKNCASCHATQAKMLAGFGAAQGKGKPSPMAKLGCKACHGQPPVRPGAASCTKCHPAGYTNIFKVWGKTSHENYRKLSIKIEEARRHRAALAAVTVDGRTGKEILEQAEADLSWAGADGSWGAHNNTYLNQILANDAEAIDRVLAEAAD